MRGVNEDSEISSDDSIDIMIDAWKSNAEQWLLIHMPETPEHSDQPADKNSKWQPIWDAAKHSGFRVLLAFAGVVLIAVILFAYKTPDPSQQMGILVVGILGVITFVVTVINAVSAARMTDIMERQESEMTEQRKAMQKQLDAMREGLAKTQEQIGLSRETNDVAQQSLIFSQRAYITTHLNVNGFYVWLNMENSGNTPANEVRLRYFGKYSEIQPQAEITAENEAKEYAYTFGGEPSLGLIAPHKRATERLVFDEDPMKQSGFETGNMKFWLWGEVEYLDVFNERRYTHFAFEVSIHEPLGRQCATGNNAY